MLPLPALVLAAVLSAAPLTPTLPADRPEPRRGGPAAASTPAASAFQAPLAGGLTVLETFRPPASPWLPGHRGVDLAASPGERVMAAGAGVVLWAGDLAGRGVVSVLHGDGRRTTYEPVATVVEAGDVVSAGETIGVVATGAAHCGGVPGCLHWGLRRGEEYLDPLTLLTSAGRPRLLPLARGAP